MTNTNVRIDFQRETIIITKAFAKSAGIYGTDEYKSLKEMKSDFPEFKIEVRTAPKKTSSTNKITLVTMENYIKKHDPDGKFIAEFKKFKNEESGDNLHKTSFFEIKKWFLEQYPELKSSKDNEKNKNKNTEQKQD